MPSQVLSKEKRPSEMTIIDIIALLATGIFVGFTGGLLGVGGAFIMVPVQYMVYADMGIPTDMAIKLAFGTNLLVILPIAISGTWRHQKNKAVWWKVALIMGSCSLVGSFCGATIATHLPGEVLKIAFGVIILLISILMLTAKPPHIEDEARVNPWLLVALGLPIGIVTGILGIGGGILVIPVMTLVLRLKMHNAIATSLAMMILTSTGGAIGYILNGINAPGLPAYSIGYINLQSWFLLTITSVVIAQFGAITTHRISANHLRYIFIAITFYVGIKMLGLFDWLGWPI